MIFIKSNKLAFIIVVSLILNGVLAYGMFWQWRSRTLMFMHAYTRLSTEVLHASAYLDRFLLDGNMKDFESAVEVQTQAFIRSNVFSHYYWNQHGSDLSHYIGMVLDPSKLWGQEENTEFLLRYQDYLARLANSLQTEEREEWVYGPRPQHPVNKEVTNRLLRATIEIVDELNER